MSLRPYEKSRITTKIIAVGIPAMAIGWVAPAILRKMYRMKKQVNSIHTPFIQFSRCHKVASAMRIGLIPIPIGLLMEMTYV